MAVSYSIPKPTEPLLDQFGKVSTPWYNYLRTRFGDAAADGIIASIEAQIADLLARVEALEEGGSTQLLGPESVRVVGTLQNGVVQFTLVGDSVNPEPEHYYGTDALGDKGFHPRLLETLLDVDIPAPLVGDVLTYDGLEWVASAPSGGGVLPVVTGEILSGQPVFVYGPDGSLVYGPI